MQGAEGQSHNWQTGLNEAASPIMERIIGFHDYVLMPVIIFVVLFVSALLFYVCIRFREKKNPVPSKTTHGVLIEVLWTVIPVLILMVVAVPSIRLLAFQEQIPQSDLTIKTTGYQWYWGYSYPETNIAFDALMLSKEEAKAKDLPRNLATDNYMVVPVNKVVRLQITSSDVIHSWAMPFFGVKKDAVPGRLNETWFKAEKTGLYYGQCSELCGKDHAFMPISVAVVSEEDYKKWSEMANDDIAKATDFVVSLYKNTNIVESRKE